MWRLFSSVSFRAYISQPSFQQSPCNNYITPQNRFFLQKLIFMQLLPVWLSLRYWRWRYLVRPKLNEINTTIHGVTLHSQNCEGSQIQNKMSPRNKSNYMTKTDKNLKKKIFRFLCIIYFVYVTTESHLHQLFKINKSVSKLCLPGHV